MVHRSAGLTPSLHDRFAANNAGDDSDMYYWMLDRQVIPQSLVSDDDIWTEYQELTKIIWPSEWTTRVSISTSTRSPLTDCALKESFPAIHEAFGAYVDELFKDVDKLRAKRLVSETSHDGEYRDIFINLVQHLSSIFEACQNTRANNFRVHCGQSVSESDWRHDFDGLLIKFFKCAKVAEMTADPSSKASRYGAKADTSDSNAGDKNACQNTTLLPSCVFVSCLY